MSDADQQLEDVRHTFATWAAARASQRGCPSFRTERCITFLGNFRGVLVKFLKENEPAQATFDAHHPAWVREVMRQAASNVTFGRAAKLINVYIKQIVVLGRDWANWRDCAHPPIDRRLIAAASATLATQDATGARWLASQAWTKLTETEYRRAIIALRLVDPVGWKLEATHWTPADAEYE